MSCFWLRKNPTPESTSLPCAVKIARAVATMASTSSSEEAGSWCVSPKALAPTACATRAL